MSEAGKGQTVTHDELIGAQSARVMGTLWIVCAIGTAIWGNDLGEAGLAGAVGFLYHHIAALKSRGGSHG